MNPHIPPLNCIQGKVHSLLEYSDFYPIAVLMIVTLQSVQLIIIPTLQQKRSYPRLFKVNLT